jgi:hypothetical protein
MLETAGKFKRKRLVNIIGEILYLNAKKPLHLMLPVCVFQLRIGVVHAPVCHGAFTPARFLLVPEIMELVSVISPSAKSCVLAPFIRNAAKLNEPNASPKIYKRTGECGTFYLDFATERKLAH